MFTNRNTIKSLQDEVAQLQSQVRLMATETRKAHDRIDQVNLRTANIEHYAGMRSHSFEDGGRMWDYMQLHRDIKANRRPKSLFTLRKHQQAA